MNDWALAIIIAAMFIGEGLGRMRQQGPPGPPGPQGPQGPCGAEGRPGKDAQ